MNRCSARLLENSTESNSKSSETDGRTCGKDNPRVSIQLRIEEPEAWHFQQFYPRQLMNPTRILTALGFGRITNLKSPMFTVRIPSAFTRRRMSIPLAVSVDNRYPAASGIICNGRRYRHARCRCF